MYLGNTPVPANTVLQLEQRKSFSFALRFLDGNDRQLDLTDCVLTIVMKPEPLDDDIDDSNNLIVNNLAELTLPARGFAVFNLQASDLAHPTGEYPYAIVLRSPGGYSSVVVKGIIQLEPNTEFASVSSTYAGANPPLSLEVEMRGHNSVDVRVGATLPPGMNYLTDAEREQLANGTVPAGGTIGQALVKASSADRDVKWAAVGGGGGGGLFPEGVPAGYVPMADGLDSWEWSDLPAVTAYALMPEDLDGLTTPGAAVFYATFLITLALNFPAEQTPGLLEIQAADDGDSVFQRYTSRLDGQVWTRMWLLGSGWTAWKAMSIAGHVHAGTDITTGTVPKERLPMASALLGISYGTAAAPTGQPDGTLYIKYTA